MLLRVACGSTLGSMNQLLASTLTRFVRMNPRLGPDDPELTRAFSAYERTLTDDYAEAIKGPQQG